jgi:hypothetical protein
LAYWVQENPMDAGGDAKYYWHLTKKLFHYLRKYMPFIETTEREVSDIMMDGFFKYTQGKGGPKGPGPDGGKKFSKDEESTKFDSYINDFFDEKKVDAGVTISKVTEDLKNSGINAKEIRLSRHLLSKKKAQHLLTRDHLLGLSELIKSPMIVHDSDHKDGRRVVITSKEIVADVDGNLAIVVDPNSGVVADVVSIHSREYKNLFEQLKQKQSSVRLIDADQIKNGCPLRIRAADSHF